MLFPDLFFSGLCRYSHNFRTLPSKRDSKVLNYRRWFHGSRLEHRCWAKFGQVKLSAKKQLRREYLSTCKLYLITSIVSNYKYICTYLGTIRNIHKDTELYVYNIEYSFMIILVHIFLDGMRFEVWNLTCEFCSIFRWQSLEFWVLLGWLADNGKSLGCGWKTYPSWAWLDVTFYSTRELVGEGKKLEMIFKRSKDFIEMDSVSL